MSDLGFHITYFSGIPKKYRIVSEETDLRLLIFPFESFHASLFNIRNFRQPRYVLPGQTVFYLEETMEIDFFTPTDISLPEIRCSLTKSEYVARVNEIKKHIHRGDMYEMNFCFEFFAEEVVVDPLQLFEKLYQKSNAPFASFTCINDLFILSASPERFIKKYGDKIISEPMKGTAPRNQDPMVDEENKKRLQNSEKEKNENVMIVDLVRNDLSRLAKRGTVQVESLFEVRSFATVHQMISTISCLNNRHSLEEILQATFPMGSMTGAPKKRVLELINQYEASARGIYSGALGMIEPNGDFDFSVVIRTIVYDAKKKYLSFSVGSAITASCHPEDEYEECLLKAKALIEVLQN